jgi:hypothetical protein
MEVSAIQFKMFIKTYILYLSFETTISYMKSTSSLLRFKKKKRLLIRSIFISIHGLSRATKKEMHFDKVGKMMKMLRLG